jgi:hypothetical protein
MMQGGSKSIGNRKLSGRENELEEYFADPTDDEVERDVAQSQESDDRGVQEELRRLTAYVSHLKRSVSEFAESPPPSPGLARASQNMPP